MFRKVKLSIRRLSRWLQVNESGQSLIIIAFCFIGLVAIVGLAIDLGIMYMEKTRLGQAVDAAALAGAHELPNEIAAWDRAEEYLRVNGYNLDDPDITFTHGFPDDPYMGVYHYQLAVTGTKTVPLTFLRVLGFTTVDIAASAVGENANKLDIMLVLDRTGSMDDDTCDITRDPGGPNQYACNLWLTNITGIFTDTFDSGLSGWTEIGTPEVRNDGYSMDGNYVALQGGWGGQEGIYRQFDTTGYDVVKVTFWTRDIGMDTGWGWGADVLRLRWRVGSGGTISTAWSQTPTSSWTQYQVELPTGAAGIPNLEVRFQLSNTESGEYALIDDVALVGANDGLGPYDGTGADNRCNGGGSQDCGGSPDPFQNYFHEQPVYDTLAASDKFLDFLDPDLDQVGLATYATSASVDVQLTSDFNAITSTLYTIDPTGCTNISDGIYAGINGLVNGRMNAVHIMILLSDGWSNTWAGSWACACDTSPPCPYDTCYEGTSEPWGKVRAAYRWAKDNQIIIFTIGQGACVNEGLLREMAEETFGRYYWAPTTDELDEIFQKIAEYIFLRLVR